MGATGLLTLAFYGLVVGSAAYFVHKVAWFVRYRRIQETLVQRALDKLREQADTTVVRWDRGADVSWSEATASTSTSPTDYVRKIEQSLTALEARLRTAHRPLRAALATAVVAPSDATEVTLFEMPGRDGSTQTIQLCLEFEPIPDPQVPPPETLKLELRSRYGFVRRALAFFLGVADVVYSSQHIVRMSQNPRAPVGMLLRRMSLVFLILAALLVDIAFSIRSRLIAFTAEMLPRYVSLGEDQRSAAAAAIGLGLWLAAYGALYVGLYLFLRWRSARHLRRLRTLQEELRDRIADIRDDHLDELARWTAEYGDTLDDAARLTQSQCEMLVQRTKHRLRRRVASRPLLDLAADVAALFFAKLPEASKGLQDVASSHRHSLRHAIWPRESEMRYQITIAQFRHAWRDIEGAVNSLRGQQPDPVLAGQLWRSLVRYARMFPEIVPDDLFARLQAAHGKTVATIVDETNAELEELDCRLRDLADALQHTVEASVSLVQSRIELTARSMEADVAAFTAEALRIREQARLEAMAFEI